MTAATPADTPAIIPAGIPAGTPAGMPAGMPAATDPTDRGDQPVTDQHLTATDEAVASTDAALARLQGILATIGDGDLHRAHRDGGWSVAQVISHVNVCGVLWLGDLKRLADDADLDFLFREEIGHDALGYAPPTTEVAIAQLDSTRRSVSRSVPVVAAEVGARVVTIPDLGTMAVAEWTPLILGHMAGHAQQAVDILVDRGAMPADAGGQA